MDLKSHMQQLEKALGESCRAIAEIMFSSPNPKERQASLSNIWRLDKSGQIAQSVWGKWPKQVLVGTMMEWWWTLSAFTEAAYTGTVFQGRTWDSRRQHTEPNIQQPGVTRVAPKGYIYRVQAPWGQLGKGLCAPGQGGSLSAHAARLKIQKALSKAVVETWAEMSVLGRKFYNKIESKTPPSRFPLCF